MAEVEDGLELRGGEELCGELAQGAEGKFVFDCIAYEGAGDHASCVGTGLRGEAMAVTPEPEGAAVLHVAEMIVPCELRDLRVPGDTDG